MTDAPWLETLAPKGQDVSVTLETEDGRTATIEGETALSTFHVMNASAGAAGMVGDFRLQQAIVQYTWDGERATGMLERSSASNQVSLNRVPGRWLASGTTPPPRRSHARSICAGDAQS